ncbi:MAG: coproporphyrinogen III oxidase, partial [Mariprofundaceae bacterium]
QREGKLYRNFQGYSKDHLRRHVIMRLMCDFSLDFTAVEKLFDINFNEHFSDAIEDLKPMQSDGLLTLGDKSLEVLPAGRMLIRNISMLFDEHLRNKQEEVRYSKVI